jgi:hypothetical protein
MGGILQRSGLVANISPSPFELEREVKLQRSTGGVRALSREESILDPDGSRRAPGVVTLGAVKPRRAGGIKSMISYCRPGKLYQGRPRSEWEISTMSHVILVGCHKHAHDSADEIHCAQRSDHRSPDDTGREHQTQNGAALSRFRSTCYVEGCTPMRGIQPKMPRRVVDQENLDRRWRETAGAIRADGTACF